MKINRAETLKRFKETGRKVTPWAMSKGFSPTYVTKVIKGVFVPKDPTFGIYNQIIESLKADDLLREDNAA